MLRHLGLCSCSLSCNTLNTCCQAEQAPKPRSKAASRSNAVVVDDDDYEGKGDDEDDSGQDVDVVSSGGDSLCDIGTSHSPEGEASKNAQPGS